MKHFAANKYNGDNYEKDNNFIGGFDGWHLPLGAGYGP